VRLTVLGGGGVWPTPAAGCSGYLVESDGYTVLIDPGYASLPALIEHGDPLTIDAVLISHGHPDHCADLNPLLRCRALRDDPPPALPAFCPPGALDAVLALDRPGMLDDAVRVHEFEPGAAFTLGPFEIRTALLPHSRPNAGMRISAADGTLVYTGDSGPSDDLVDLARDADLLLAEATYPDRVPDDLAATLSSATDRAAEAHRAGVGRLILTHLAPDGYPDGALDAARVVFAGRIDIARPGLVVTPR
jgi:ribonuclease BN (tRNA processing enzyme)